MSNLFDRETANKLAIETQKYSPERLTLNFCEDSPVSKIIFELKPKFDIAISKIQYFLATNDFSANGIIQLIGTYIQNPDIWSIVSENSQIVFNYVGGANQVNYNIEYFFDRIYLKQETTLYIYLVSNCPQGLKVFGSLNIEFLPMIK